MAPDAQFPRSSSFILLRESQDTRVRTRLGGIYYLFAWVLTWSFSAAPNAMLVLGLGGTAFFALMMVLRWLHRLPVHQNDEYLRQWIDRHWALILLTSLAWGLAHAWALLRPDFEPSRLIATLSTVAFGTAMAFNFPMRKQRCVVAILLLYAPGMAVLAWQWPNQEALAVTLAFYLSYLLLALNRSHREYHATLTMEQQLVDQRERYEQLSRTDSLTQLGNRLQFNALFPAMVANARRQGTPLSLVLLDIDFFKRINDEHGHSSGDACLSDFAERMRQVFRRDSDALLRLGGEEFGVLMPGTPLDEACQLAERFRMELATRGFELHGQRLPLTTSLGAGCLDTELDESAEAFFKRVDDALYRAKAEGRDRLALALS
ncbi:MULTISPECIES: GGDEF domain-containing protein [unclassified Pseudomonas]|uniref:GGDEF domain-containing protein n=1 Tax=unclassified Pseudomonas TaxID=196821 RepID=UPI00244686D8|nr:MULTISPECIES: GGDEF domain-containing protein [unclassified Pseudomonas]MDG9924575.1 GGDEF domain-containing protein [Pseudomonas sp. GD04045]MDH0033552.1 GGDEF domain-containing protein [Pseudomonas sp. GD04019]